MEAEKIEIRFELNGKKVKHEVYPMQRLLDVIREQAKLTGTKEGCGEGECGACAVLIDGELAVSCLVPAIQVRGARVTTIEGVGGTKLHRLQDSFLKEGGAQCGICTPGMILASLPLLKKKRLTETDVREGLAGNLCRCTGYMRIFASVLKARQGP